MKIQVAADSLLSFLSNMGIKTLHNYPGGTIAPILDACAKYNVEVITSRHEQGAGYAALAQAKITKLPGIVAVTSGPGVTNILTPVADAYFDSIPMLVFTGQVGTSDLSKDLNIRQRGFQEVDTPSLMKPITKAQFQPHSVDDFLICIAEAWQIAMSGRKGPVSIDLPMDIQRSSCNQEIKANLPSTVHHDESLLLAFINNLIKALKKAKRPVVICGNGMLDEHLKNTFEEIVKLWPAPVSHSLLGLGLLDTNSHLNLGFHGHTGSPVAGHAIYSADLLLILGSRLDLRQTGSLYDEFAPNAEKFRVDFDDNEVKNARIHSENSIIADLHHALPLIFKYLKSGVDKKIDLSDWHIQIDQIRQKFPWPYPEYPGIPPKHIIEKLSAAINSPVICITGVGLHQHWSARHFHFNYPDRQLFTSAGHGAMGYDLPTAIGAAIHSPDSQILCIVGDGSFQMNIQELGLIAELNLNIKIVVLDNQRLGLVSQFQLMNWETDVACGEKKSPNFAQIAQGYDIASYTAATTDEFDNVIDDFINTTSASLLHITIDERHDVLPLLLGGQPMNKMWPYYDMSGNSKELVK